MTNTNTEYTGPTFAECDVQTLLHQIGGGNLAAISGGRWGRILQGDKTTGVDLPVDRNCRVHVNYMSDDTYSVTRIRPTVRRRGGVWVNIQLHEGYMVGVGCENVGELAYQASCYHNGPFGQAKEES